MFVLKFSVVFACCCILHAEQLLKRVTGSDDGNCQCMQLEQCDETRGGVITDVSGLIMYRSGTGCKSDEVCCEYPEDSSPDGNKDEELYADDDGYSNPDRTDAVDEEDDDIASPAPFICGFRHPSATRTKISGDRDDTNTEQGDFPWTLIVKYLVPVEQGGSNDQVLVCGASLIAPSLAITAAHSIERKIAKNLIVRAGEWDLGSDDETIAPQERAVQHIIMHPKYDMQPIQYDIAILVLEKPFQANIAVNTLCLPEPKQKFSDWGNCYATGWGAAGDGAIPMDDAILRKAKMPLVDHDECQRLLRKTEVGKRYRLHRSFICAGGDGETDTCKGDGGGPLACESSLPPYKFHLVGVTSWGVGCSRKDVPGAYTSVAVVLPWIQSTVQKLVLDRVIPSQ